jgi:beta-glucanase (GH16 family)
LDRRRYSLLAHQVGQAFSGIEIHADHSDFEWLDPSTVTTANGHMVITMNQQVTNDLNLISGQVQTWNQLCFNKNAYFETSVSLPGRSDVGGFWPGVWTMGNLGRAGYGASNEGE